MSALTARYSRPKLVLYELGVLGFVGIGALLVTRPAASFATMIGGSAAIIFFGICALVIVRRFFDSGYILTINAAGIFDRRATDRVIPWSAVTRISEVKIRRQRFYLLELSQPLRQFVDDSYKRWLLRLNRPWVRNGVFVSANGLSATHDEIGAAVRKYWKLPSLSAVADQ